MAEPFRFTTPMPWEPNVVATPEQMAGFMKACTDEERVEIARRLQTAQDTAHRCFLGNHARLAEEVQHLRWRTARLHAAWRSARRRANALRAVADGLANYAATGDRITRRG